MTFAGLTRGASVFLDANTFVFHFQPHTQFGPPCTALLQQIELQHIVAYSSTHVLGEVGHRLMTGGSFQIRLDHRQASPASQEQHRRCHGPQSARNGHS